MPSSIENLIPIVGGIVVGIYGGPQAGFATYAALSYVVASTKSGPKSFVQPDQGQLVTLRQSAAPWQIIYGEQRVGGVLTFFEVLQQNEIIQMVITLAGHEVDEIGDIYFDDYRLSLDANGLETGRFRTLILTEWDESGLIGTPIYGSYVTVIKSEGDEGASQPFPDLVSGTYASGKWTQTGHLQRGRAKILVRMKWSAALFPRGLPNITAVVKGKKVLDPRYSPAVTAWSDNAALCLADYLTDSTYGLSASASEIDQTQLISAANSCDELVELRRSPTEYEKRYTLNGRFDTSMVPQNVIENMLTAMQGRLIFVGGVWRIHPAVYSTPTETLTADDLRGPVHILPRVQKRDLCNGVKGVYISPENDYQATDFPPVTNATYLSDDQGERIWRDISLPFTNTTSMSQRLAKIELERTRQQAMLELPCKLTMYRVRPGDTILVTLPRYGYTAKAFEVLSSTLSFEAGNDDGGMTLGVDLLLRETASSVYDWNAGEETVVDTAPDTDLPDPFASLTIPQVNVSSGTDDLVINGDGTIVPRVRLTWTEPDNAFIDHYEIQISSANTETWVDATQVKAPATEAFAYPVVDGDIYDLRIRAVTSLGNYGLWYDIRAHTVIGKTEPPSDVEVFTIDGTTLTWSAVMDVDLAGYRLRFQQGTRRSWGDAAWLHGIGDEQDLVSGPPFVMLVVPSGQVTLMVKAVDTSGNESTNAAYIVTDLGDPVIANIILTFDRKAAGFPGTKTNGSVSGGDLVADTTTLMWAMDDQADMWRPDPSLLMWATPSYAQMVYEDRIIVTRALAGSLITITAAVAGDPWSLEYRENSQQLMWDADTSKVMWSSDSSTVMWFTPDYQPWPGQIVANESLYDFRITTGQGVTQGVVSTFKIDVDAPDKNEFLANVAIGAGGTRLTLTKSYDTIKGVNLTLLNDGGTALTAKQEDLSTSGPLIKCYDTASAATSGHVNALVQGF